MSRLKEKNIYDGIEQWLVSEYSAQYDEYRTYQNQQMCYGKAMRAGFDVMLVGYEVNKRVRKPSEWCVTDLHICECKLLWNAYVAFGQLAFYQNIVENYMKSRHWQAFNDDGYNGPLKYFKKKKKLPTWFREDNKEVVYYLPDKIGLYLTLVLYGEDSRDQETKKYLEFVEQCLSQQPETGMILYWHDRIRNKIEVRKEPPRIDVLHGGRLKPIYDVEDACLIPPFATKQSCRWFTKDGYYGYKGCLTASKFQSSCVGCANNW